MVCGAPPRYLSAEEEQGCAFCGRESQANAICEHGHFVCDTCHAEDALAVIEHICRTTTETDMIALMQTIRSHPALPVNGPEHHALAPGIILATYRNLGGELTGEHIRRGILRGSQIPGGACAFLGACGAAVGVLETKGFVDDEDLDAFRRAGYTDEHVAEVVTILAQKTLSNYFNHIHDTPLDVPVAAEV